MEIYQDLNPRGLASNLYGGLTYRLMIPLDINASASELRHPIFYSNTGQQVPRYYSWTTPVNFALMSRQAKEAGIKFVVNNSMSLNNSNTNPEFFARVTGVIADLMVEQGWNRDNAAIALFNEPSKFVGQGRSGAIKYVEYVKRAHEIVNGRFKLWIVNDEYFEPILDLDYIFDHLPGIPKEDIIFGTHYLSSLGKTPAWNNVVYAKTRANEWGVAIGCSEGGAWYHPYRSETGHGIIVKLLEECKKYDYEFCAIVCIDNNEYTIKTTSGTLGYRVWNDNYTINTRSLDYWSKWLDIIKEYKEEEAIMSYLRPLVQQEFYEAMGLGTKPYHENTPSLPIVGRKDANKALTWGSFDAVIETILKGLISGLKENGALPETFPGPMNIKYKEDGSWNNNWQSLAKEREE